MAESAAEFPSMHGFDAGVEELADAILAYAKERVRLDPPPLDHPKTVAELTALAGQTITETGLGGMAALSLFAEVLAPACVSVDFPRHLSFVPAAPTDVAALFDVVVGVSSIFGGSWMEGAGAIYAENQALRWLSDLAGLPAEAGGCFVSGGTAGNLSALVAARFTAEKAHGRPAQGWAIIAGETAHSSIVTAARIMDVELVLAPGDSSGRLTGEATSATLASLGSRVFAVVAAAGSTNLGLVDDLEGVGRACNAANVWFHVDAAYGGAALVAPSVRDQFKGIERCDSFVVDPHKWLFAPFDCCALIYREPNLGRAAHTQHAGYLEVLTSRDEWNPSDYAAHLTRRARGLPFWFSLACHGAAAYRHAVERTLVVARRAAELIELAPHTELVSEPSLSVVVFRRLGWHRDDYHRWSTAALADGLAFVVPTIHQSETVLRFCFVNPRTTAEDVSLILSSLA